MNCRYFLLLETIEKLINNKLDIIVILAWGFKDNEVRKMIEEITPLGRMGDAEDIANIVEFLCSSKASFLTGNSFMVDGGLSLVGQETIARNLL